MSNLLQDIEAQIAGAKTDVAAGASSIHGALRGEGVRPEKYRISELRRS